VEEIVLKMSRRMVVIAIFILFSMVHCMIPPYGYADEAHTYVFMDEPISPYTLGNEGEICKKGLTIEIFDELFGRLGMRYEIRLVPWARAIDSLKYGECDGIPLMMKTKERESYLKYTDPVVENREVLYYLPERIGNFQWNTLKDLKGLKIGMVRGYAYADYFMEGLKEHNLQVSYVKDATMNLAMLKAGRVDMIIEDETIAKGILAQDPTWAKRIATPNKIVSKYYWHIGISRQSPLANHIDDINSVLDNMREDGSLRRILDKR